MKRTLTTIVVTAAALLLAGPAHAIGGNYVIKGGTPKQQAEVRAALDASSFDWDVVPGRVAIRIVRGSKTYSSRGKIVLDSRLIEAGRPSWAIIQHEYAHQVHFFLFGPETAARVNRAIGGRSWCYEVQGLDHHQYGCERFASTLAWAYWPSSDNVLKPRSPNDESAAMAPAKFRALVASLLRAPRYASR
jgi:hypothetical protein